MTRRRLILALVAVAAAGLAAALVLPQAFAGAPTTFKARVYQLKYTVRGDAAIRVYASLSSGAWREDIGGETRVSTARGYQIVDHETGEVYHRSGSARFMGFLTSPPPAVSALQMYLAGHSTLPTRTFALSGSPPLRVAVTRRGGQTELRALRSGKLVFTVRIERRISDQAAARLDIFGSRPADVFDQELPVGTAPSVPVRAYWFGPSINGKRAAAAAQHERHRTPQEAAGGMNARGESEAQITLYEDPGVTDSSVQPGLTERPAGELQISNEPVTSAHAQAFVAALNGQNGDQSYPAWPRTTVQLADGESVDVVPDLFDGDDGSHVATGFTVITATTLTHVSGPVPFSAIPSMASRLVPLQ